MLNADGTVILLDVDNTLLDNDRFSEDLDQRLEAGFGPRGRERYWSLCGALRDELGYVDYLGALQRFRAGLDDAPALLQMSSFLLDYPFARRLFPRAIDTIAHLDTLGLTVLLSDGDIVFQPRKVQRSGLWKAVAGRVVIAVHKERALEAMQRRYPASHYVMVDDKPSILAAMKRTLGARLTTIFVRQGHYAAQVAAAPSDPLPDLRLERIGELMDLDRAYLGALAPDPTVARGHAPH